MSLNNRVTEQRMRSAGILPVIRGYVLLGREHSNKSWSGFVGRSEHNETPHDTAVREFDEESCGLFDPAMIRQVLSKENSKESGINLITHATTITPRGYTYDLFAIDVEKYVHSNPMYGPQNIEKLFQTYRDKETDPYRREKDIVQWVPLRDVNNLHCRYSFYNDYNKLLPEINKYYSKF